MSSLRHVTVFAAFIMTSLAACNKVDTGSAVTLAEVADPVPSAAGGDKPSTTDVTSLAWLVRNSPFVFVGRLLGKRVETDARGLVVTRNHFAVQDTLIGTPPQNVVTLTTLGGTMGAEEVSVSHTPEFVDGQTYVIFTDLARTTYNPITGDDHGVFRVVSSQIYTYEGQAVAGVQDGRIRLSSVMLDGNSGASPRHLASEIGNPTVGGSVTSVKRAIVQPAPAIRLAEFSRLVLAARQ